MANPNPDHSRERDEQDLFLLACLDAGLSYSQTAALANNDFPGLPPVDKNTVASRVKRIRDAHEKYSRGEA